MAHEGLVSRLLSRRNQLSRLEKEQVLERVLAGIGPGRGRRRTAWLAAGFGLAAAAALALVLPRLSPSQRPGGETFTARGGGEPAVFHAHCVETASPAEPTASASGCRAGAKLVFEVSAGEPSRFFAAFARRGDGSVIWYFPDTAAGTSKDLSRDLVRGVLSTSIVLGPEHPPGDYEIYGVFSNRALDRVAVKALIGSNAAASPPAGTVSVQKVTIE
jgi:hypothetical protein